MINNFGPTQSQKISEAERSDLKEKIQSTLSPKKQASAQGPAKELAVKGQQSTKTGTTAKKAQPAATGFK